MIWGSTDIIVAAVILSFFGSNSQSDKYSWPDVLVFLVASVSLAMLHESV